MTWDPRSGSQPRKPRNVFLPRSHTWQYTDLWSRWQDVSSQNTVYEFMMRTLQILVVTSVSLINSFCPYRQATWEVQLSENSLVGKESEQRETGVKYLKPPSYAPISVTGTDLPGEPGVWLIWAVSLLRLLPWTFTSDFLCLFPLLTYHLWFWHFLRPWSNMDNNFLPHPTLPVTSKMK